MDVILRKDVENLGLEFDTVSVKPGYARNYLIPKGFASLATPKAKAILAQTLQEREAQEQEIIKVATDKIKQIKAVELTLKAKVGVGDKLFGSISNADIAEELGKNGVEIDRKFIKVSGNTIKRLGKYTVKVRLHRNVEIDYELEVIPE